MKHSAITRDSRGHSKYHLWKQECGCSDLPQEHSQWTGPSAVSAPARVGFPLLLPAKTECRGEPGQADPRRHRLLEQATLVQELPESRYSLRPRLW